MGGEQRYETGLVDALLNDDIEQIAAAIRRAIRRPRAMPRSSQVERFIALLAAFDPENRIAPRELRSLWQAQRDGADS
jgi:malonate decarboxylase beta subunit